jgi:hypothetical protein
MRRRTATVSSIEAMRAFALTLPSVEEGVACAGTALESRTLKARGKAFLFLGKKDVRLKLGASASEAKRLGAEVGAHGWTKFAVAEAPPPDVVERWIDESYRLLAPAKPAAAPPGRR